MGEWTVPNVCRPKSKIDHFTCKFFLYWLDHVFWKYLIFLGYGIRFKGRAWMHSTQLCTGIRRRTHQGQVIGQPVMEACSSSDFLLEPFTTEGVLDMLESDILKVLIVVFSKFQSFFIYLLKNCLIIVNYLVL